jgi:hypothetical protein
MFLGLLDPDPLVRGMDPDPALDLDPHPSIIIKIVRKTLIPTLKYYVNVPSKSNKQKNCVKIIFLLAS